MSDDVPCCYLQLTRDRSSPPEKTYKEWKIALVVNVLYTSEADGQKVTIALDLSRK